MHCGKRCYSWGNSSTGAFRWRWRKAVFFARLPQPLPLMAHHRRWPGREVSRKSIAHSGLAQALIRSTKELENRSIASRATEASAASTEQTAVHETLRPSGLSWSTTGDRAAQTLIVSMSTGLGTWWQRSTCAVRYTASRSVFTDFSAFGLISGASDINPALTHHRAKSAGVNSRSISRCPRSPIVAMRFSDKRPGVNRNAKSAGVRWLAGTHWCIEPV